MVCLFFGTEGVCVGQHLQHLWWIQDIRVSPHESGSPGHIVMKLCSKLFDRVRSVQPDQLEEFILERFFTTCRGKAWLLEHMIHGQPGTPKLLWSPLTPSQTPPSWLSPYGEFLAEPTMVHVIFTLNSSATVHREHKPLLVYRCSHIIITFLIQPEHL